jgi:hypothetical protein
MGNEFIHDFVGDGPDADATPPDNVFTLRDGTVRHF